MADKKTLSPEEKKLAAEKHVDELVQKALVALEEMRKLDQEQVDYIVAKAICGGYLTLTVSSLFMPMKKLVVESLKTRRRRTYSLVNTL